MMEDQLLDWLRGLAATYTEHGSITSEKPENRSKSGARNHGELTLLAIPIKDGAVSKSVGICFSGILP